MEKRYLILPLLAGILLAGCTSSKVSTTQLAAQKAIYERETAAIIQSNGATVIDKDLDAITQADKDAEGYVEVVTWTDGAAAQKYFNAPGALDTMGTHLTWVTKVSQSKSFAKEHHMGRLKGQQLALRIEQMLGIPPQCDTTGIFLVMMVRPENLFRPCRDPEISDCECATAPPIGAFSPANTTCQLVYEDLITSTKGYPWTRMGYTYDWQNKNKTHFGPSEYIIAPGSIVKIVAKTPSEAWVQNP